MRNNSRLIEIQRNPNDEFYTLREDIEKEMINYKEQLKGKIIYLPADKPGVSEFWNFFYDNFKEYEIEELWASYFTEDAKLYKYDGDKIKEEEMEGNGDILSLEVKENIKKCDIVITNPPFSIWKKIYKMLKECGVDFLILGNLLAVNYKDIIDDVIKGEIVSGYNNVSEFKTPGKEKSVPTRWYTTLHVEKERFDKEEYYKYYDNYDALNVDSLKEMIPILAYKEKRVGVPITILHELPRFKGIYKVVAASSSKKHPMIFTKTYDNITMHNKGEVKKIKKYKPTEFVLKLKDKPKDKRYFTVEGENGYFVEIFKRVIIKRIDEDE